MKKNILKVFFNLLASFLLVFIIVACSSTTEKTTTQGEPPTPIMGEPLVLKASPVTAAEMDKFVNLLEQRLAADNFIFDVNTLKAAGFSETRFDQVLRRADVAYNVLRQGESFKQSLPADLVPTAAESKLVQKYESRLRALEEKAKTMQQQSTPLTDVEMKEFLNIMETHVRAGGTMANIAPKYIQGGFTPDRVQYVDNRIALGMAALSGQKLEGLPISEVETAIVKKYQGRILKIAELMRASIKK